MDSRLGPTRGKRSSITKTIFGTLVVTLLASFGGKDSHRNKALKATTACKLTDMLSSVRILAIFTFLPFYLALIDTFTC